ncbi:MULTISPECIES: tail protein X [Bradyrhizobium]|uniref:tail protein X n=1 Tax=Bradyrhizobium TaxID=374 RepID=UPI00160F4ADA|nr:MULTISPECIES: tail protein X [Bradyrhizobium]MBB4398754.1 phage tail protein X [Bradyrhizobium sp. ERR14]MBR0867316.1 tail protein X [Bradyrhizobium diazoefficiens]MBR0891826.1 tail protein X [Bradyrhizobium diazoefficiens]MBR0923590.1 tail protein X [Bradyrhizobium diazoefficiens]
MEQYTTIEGDTVDLIAYNRFGVTHGATEAILRANPGLAAAGTKLPQGMTINIPAFTVKKVNTAARIWS